MSTYSIRAVSRYSRQERPALGDPSETTRAGGATATEIEYIALPEPLGIPPRIRLNLLI